MLLPIFEHLWQSTLFAMAAALVAFALHNNRAQVRYCVWLSASLKFLVPFSLFVALGSHIPWTPSAQPVVSLAVQQIARPLEAMPAYLDPPQIAAEPSSAIPLAEWLLFAIWICGFVTVLLLWSKRWMQIRAAVASATSLSLETPIPTLSLPTLLEPGVFGVFRPVLLLPAGITSHLTRAHLDAILAHELCHLRRRDNLAAAVHMLIEAIFWFHPLVWWIGARLIDERERACDEEVLLLGNQPHIYAESILKTCQFYLESPLECFSGVTGSDLKKRIVHIMSSNAAARLNFRKKLLLVASGVSAIALPLSIGLTNAPLSRGQSEAASSTHRPAFDIISIKPSPPSFRPSMPLGNNFKLWMGPDNHMILSNVTLQFLIKYAYRLNDDQVSGVPVWFRSKHWDIDAKCDPPVGGDPRKLSFEQRQAYEGQMLIRLQSLLADRFHLKLLLQDRKQANVFDLVVARNGPKFEQTAPPGPDGQVKRGSIVVPGHIEVYRAGMEILARMLSDFSSRTVLNRTGLTGEYDLKLDWTPDSAEPPDQADAGPALSTALQQQLGLKLEAAKGSVPILVVEDATLPDAN